MQLPMRYKAVFSATITGVTIVRYTGLTLSDFIKAVTPVK